MQSSYIVHTEFPLALTSNISTTYLLQFWSIIINWSLYSDLLSFYIVSFFFLFFFF